MRTRLVSFGLCAILTACGLFAAKSPWGAAGSSVPAEHADVRTLNTNYQRLHSEVLVREVARPTRAALDYAAYHANFMIADPEPEQPPTAAGPPNTEEPFDGTLEKASLTSDVNETALTPIDRRQPLAFAPLVEFLLARKVESAENLQRLASAVQSETWGYPATPGSPYQKLSELYLHPLEGGKVELWAKVEFQPWFKPFAGAPDQDGDGVAELYGRVQGALTAPSIIASIRGEYMGPLLSASELKKWANELSSYWYPSFNTDLLEPGPSWPDKQTEPGIVRELGDHAFADPTIVLRGKPQGKPTYAVLIVKPAAGAGKAPPKQGLGPLTLPKSKPAPQTQPIIQRVTAELAAHSAASNWSDWERELAPLRSAISRKLRATPAKTKGLVGSNGFLFYRHSLEYVVGGDLEKQRAGKNPLPVIVAFKKLLEEQGVDFLFVPVPTKLELYPDELDAAGKPFVGQIINPASRKFLLALARAGVEVVDLLTPFLAARTGKANDEEPLYQHQDTHWTSRGLRLAADVISARVTRYAWYEGVARHAQSMGLQNATFSRFGDLHSRISPNDQRKYQPETLSAQQVLLASGTPYDDDADSPIVLLGDSFTGVYQLTDAEHAGVSAHLARKLAYPLDLVMSYGGGPNVRQKLMRRGEAGLKQKKLVIWMMTSRDLFDYWEDWASL